MGKLFFLSRGAWTEKERERERERERAWTEFRFPFCRTKEGAACEQEVAWGADIKGCQMKSLFVCAFSLLRCGQHGNVMQNNQQLQVQSSGNPGGASCPVN
jgi:hypothetical protein